MAINDFGINFASRTLRKFYEQALAPVITNKDYEGEIKSFGDRIRILSFLHDIAVNDYSAGSDMGTQSLYDTTDELVIDQQKYYNFGIDKVEELFTYANDLSEALIQNASKEIEKTVDTFVLTTIANGIKAGNMLGQNLRIIASGSDTDASIATTSTGGTITLTVAGTTGTGGTAYEAGDGTLYFSGFTSADLGKAIRLTSGNTWATEWYRIASVTDSNTAGIVNWDDSTEGFPIPNGDVLKGLYGGRDFTSDANGDGKPTSMSGWGWEFQAAIPTTVTAATIYDALTILDEMLNKGHVPAEDRHIVLPHSGKTMLLQASELQPSGIEMLYTNTIVNGKVARVAGFDVHVTSQGNFSSSTSHSTAAGLDASCVLTAGPKGYVYPAFHRSYCTFAFKWSESRTVDAENQFAKKYQGLYLYGAKVPTLRRECAVGLYATAL